MAPIVYGLEAQYVDRINFTYLDIDDPQTDQFKQALNYRVQPHIFLLDAEGHVVQAWLGRVDEAEFVSAFQKVLSN
jgi:hypothetical protein